MTILHHSPATEVLGLKFSRHGDLRDTAFNGTDCFNTAGGPTVLQGNRFGGIPTVLLIYFIFFWLLIFIFSLLRKIAWDYGRLALISDIDSEAVDSPRKYKRFSSFSSNSERIVKDVGFCSWLSNIFTMKDSEMREHCGDDAIHYLSFQRHIIVLLVAISVMSVGIILPVNMSGSLLDRDPQSFGRTTIGNIKINNNLLWLHTVFAVVYLLLTILVLRHYTSSMQYREDDVVKCSLFITGMPKDVSEETIANHFREAYPTCTVLEVQLCYDVAKLIELDTERRKAGRGRKYYTKLLQSEGKSFSINPKPCGWFCCCSFKGCEQVDAVEYYTKLEGEIMNEFTTEKELVDRKSLGLAFVTFQDKTMASLVLRDFNTCRCQGCNCRGETKASSHSQSLGVSKWNVTYAPDPKSIYCYLNNPVISQFFPTLLLWAFTALLPTIVYYSAIFEGHWTRSAENRITMHKLYSFLITMVLILPSLGLTSVDVFFRWLFDKSFLERAKIRFECVFLPDQGAFFVNYVIASAFIGNSMALLRFPSLLLYTVRMVMAKSAAERKVVKLHQAYGFEFGVNYAWVLCIFTVVVAYSITCPIIVPFGLIYIMLKYLVDKYNLYYAYLPAKLNRRMHAAVVNQALAAPILCLFWLLFFSVLRGGLSAPTSIFTFTVVLLTIVVCIFVGCFGYSKYFAINMAVKVPAEETEAETTAPWRSKAYVPRVLHGPKSEKSHLNHHDQPSYGATGDNSQPLEEEASTPPLDYVEDDDRIYLVDTGASEI
ncbi:CSC1-like protein 2 [Heptranchias perlo]|uniref:CSC1-like protein 2 n=1 Tax=Heptranchias perlo TaxID=212740 RepID=UPI00355A65F0